MKKIVIIGANDFQNPLILKARELGYETHVFAWKEGAIGEKTADYFYPISIVEKERILEKCKKIKPNAVLSIGSDLATITVNYVAEKLGLTCNPYSITENCTNKFKMRDKFKINGIKTPNYLKVTKNYKNLDIDNLAFPLIVKPTDRSGSRGVTKVNNKNELISAVKYATNVSFEKCAIIEEYIEGNEYSCECISYNGKHYFLTFTKKFTTGAPNFIETGHEQPSDIKEEYQDNIKKEIFKALDALNIKNGASHTEFKLDNNGNITIIEIGARMAGDCIGSDLVLLSTGYDYLKMVIDIALGKKINFTKKDITYKAKIYFILKESDYKLYNKLSLDSSKSVYKTSKFNTNYINDVTDSSTRLGYYIIIE